MKTAGENPPGKLRRMAGNLMKNEAAGRSLQATALVHEAYLQLVGQESAQ